MVTDIPLPGLERLLSVCKETGYPLEVLPPGSHPPAAGALVAGHPFDPVLAAMYRRLGGARFGGELGHLRLYRVNDERNGIAETTEELRETTEPFHSTVLFGGASGMAWYYASVPRLVDERGRQPVVFIEAHEECRVLPVASNVDRFLELYAHYVELLVRDECYLVGEPPEVFFPNDVLRHVARDKPLVEMLAAGRFDFLMRHAPASFEWVEQVRLARA